MARFQPPGASTWESIMARSVLHHGLFAGVALLSACQTAPVTSAMQPHAVETALTRAHYDLQCPAPRGQVQSLQALPPLLEPGPMLPGTGIQRAEFTIGITGCSRPATMVVICSQENGCFAGQPG